MILLLQLLINKCQQYNSKKFYSTHLSRLTHTLTMSGWILFVSPKLNAPGDKMMS